MEISQKQNRRPFK